LGLALHKAQEPLFPSQFGVLVEPSFLFVPLCNQEGKFHYSLPGQPEKEVCYFMLPFVQL
jgi:hypothetical protein